MGLIQASDFLETPLILCAIAVVMMAIIIRRQRNSMNLPPGPWGLPVVGILPFLGKDPHLSLMKWAKQYGDIFSVKMGTTTAVILNGYETIRDVFQRKGAYSSGRPHMPTMDFLKGKGLFVADFGETQSAQRNFTLKYLAKADIEKRAEDEINALLQYIRDKNGEPIHLNGVVSVTVANVIGAILFGCRQDYDDPNFQKLVESYENATKHSGPAAVENFLPFLWFLPQCIEGRKAWNVFANCVKQQLEKHRNGYDSNVTRGLIDAFMHQSNVDTEKQSFFKDGDLLTYCQSLYFAGSETTSTAISWGLLFLLHNPDVCDRMRAEMDEKVGKFQRPGLADKTNLPYVCATIMEIQRCNYIGPVSLPHKATADIHIDGFVIPEGTTLLALYWSLFMDEDIWPDPHEFRPSRFLDDLGNLRKMENFIPFSLGKRSCAGEILARHEMFLVITALVQTFTFHIPDGEALPDTIGTTGLLYVPPKVVVSARPRC